MATRKLEAQLALVDSLDTKAGVLVGGLAVAIVAFLQQPLTQRHLWIGGILLAAALSCAIRAFMVGMYDDAPTARVVVEYANHSPDELKELFLSSVLDAYDVTYSKVIAKGQWINRAVFIGGVTVILAFAGQVLAV